MIRHAYFHERHRFHASTFAMERVRMRDLKAQLDEYGGIDLLCEDLRLLDDELATNADGTFRWAHHLATTNNGTWPHEAIRIERRIPTT